MAAQNPIARLITLIHIARRDLMMEEDAYRAALMAVTGKRSSSDMTMPELKRALAHLKRCGFKVKPKRAAGSRPQAPSDQAAMMRALWLQLHQAGRVRDPSESALAKWAERETGIAALQWLDVSAASKTIEKLKKWLNR